MYTIDKARAAWRTYSKTPKGKYQCQKRTAKKRKISWEFTFESWWNFWQVSWENRGNYNLVMARKNDTGPYSPKNCYITTHKENLKDAWKNERFKNRQKNNRNIKGQFIRKEGT